MRAGMPSDDESEVAPAFGASTVQEALDAIKAILFPPP
jgi:hypothetical protein